MTPKASYGYGGKFGVETDRMDKVAVGHDYVAQVQQHSSQKDAAKGFGGKFGVEKDRLDKSAVGFEYKGEVKQHTSQKGGSNVIILLYRIFHFYLCLACACSTLPDYSKGFGGKYGVEKEKVDKAAVGYDYKGQTEKHQSQRDYSKGFGGKYGVEKEKVDKAAVGYDYQGRTEKHQSQKDYSAGFGGRYGVQSERMDKSAADFSDMDSPASAYEKTQPIEASGANAGKLKARFESLAKASDEENRRRVEEEKSRRKDREKRERQEAERKQQEQKSREDQLHLADVPEVLADFDASLEMYQSTAEEPQPQSEAQLKTFDAEPPALPVRSDHILQMPPVEEAEDAYIQVTVDGDDYEDVAPPPPTVGEGGNDYKAVAPPPPTVGEGDDDDYEEVCTTPPAASSATDDYEDLSGGVQAVAIYDYLGEDVDEISFNPDDVITDIEMIDEGWWKGRCHGQTGLFPAAYVQLMQ
ncbi:src substrate protein p85-like isoform X3 [Vanacampus margaritifer]